MPKINKSKSTITEQLIDFLQRNKTSLIIISVLFIAVFGYEIFNFTLGSDEELEIMYNHYNTVMIGLGRFSYWILEEVFLIGGKLVPFSVTFFSVVLLFMASILFPFYFEYVLQQKISKMSIISFAATFITVSFVNAPMMTIGGYNLHIHLGIFLVPVICILSYEGVKNKNKIMLFLAILLLTFTIGIYQSFAVMFITTIVITLLLELYSKKSSLVNTFINAFKYFLIFVSSMIFYLVIDKIMKIIFSQNISYISDLIGWNSETPILEVLKGVFVYIKFLLLLDKNFGGIPLIFSYILFLICLTIVVIKNNRNIVVICLGLTLLISPFLISIVSGSQIIPIRALQPLPLVIGFIWFFLVEFFVQKKPISTIAFITSLVIFFSQGQIMNKIFYGDHLRYKLDQEVASLINYDILKNSHGNLNVPVVFVGGYRHNENPMIIRLDVIGVSFFELDGGRNSRIHAFMQHQSYNYTMPSVEEMTLAKSRASDMSNWPLDGSVKTYDDMIVVKLGDITENWCYANNVNINS